MNLKDKVNDPTNIKYNISTRKIKSSYFIKGFLEKHIIQLKDAN